MEKEMKEKILDKLDGDICPRCKRNKLHSDEIMNSLSRRDNKTHICSGCGTDESMFDYYRKDAPKEEIEQEKSWLNEELHPNCSELTWKLNVPKNIKEEILDKLDDIESFCSNTSTDTFPNGALTTAIRLLKEQKEKGNNIDDIEINIIENSGGGGNEYFVRDCLKLAKAYVNGEVTREEAEEYEKKLWDDEDIEELLNPNCSEMVLKLNGTLDDIKSNVIKMAKAIYEEDEDNEALKEYCKNIENINNIDEFESLVINDRCDYPTVFKKEKDSLKVGTTRNITWEDYDVDYETVSTEEEDDYHEVSQNIYYKLLFREGNKIVAKEEYSKKDNTIFFEFDGYIDVSSIGNIDLYERKDGMYFLDANSRKLKKIKFITDKVLKNKLGVLAKLQ